MMAANGFSSLHVVSDEITNPLSINRKGMTLGEGAAIFLVTRDSSGIRLRGVGESTERDAEDGVEDGQDGAIYGSHATCPP